MGLVGRLEDLALPDIFHIISLTRKTGKLTLTRREGTGVVVFSNGEVIYAASDSVRDTLGNILVCQKLITESILIAAMEAQHRSPTGKRLGTILVEKGYLTKEMLQKVIQQQIEKAIYEFLAWKNGFFKFDVSDVPEGKEVDVDVKDFLLDEGLSSDYLLLEGMKRLDEQKREQALKNTQPRPEAAPRKAAKEEPLEPQGESLGPLKAVLSGIRSPTFASEVTLTLMRFAAEIVNRGVLFCLTKDGIRGMGQFGININGGHPDELVRRMLVPVNQPSILAEVNATRKTFRGKLQKTAWNDYLVKQLGGSVPQEVIAVPMIVSGRVVMIFYGDDLPKNRPIREVEGLELVMIHAGLAMEKNILEKKIESLEQKYQEIEGSKP